MRSGSRRTAPTRTYEAEFCCTDCTAVTVLARGLLALRTALQPGDVLSVEWRRQPNLIEQGLG
jgi:hypothetical protein